MARSFWAVAGDWDAVARSEMQCGIQLMVIQPWFNMGMTHGFTKSGRWCLCPHSPSSLGHNPLDQLLKKQTYKLHLFLGSFTHQLDGKCLPCFSLFPFFPGRPGRPGPCDRTSSPTAPLSAAVPGPGPWCAWSAWRRSQCSTRQLGGSWARGIQGNFQGKVSWDFAGILNFGGVILVELMDFWWFWWVESCWKQSNGWLHLVANLHIGWIWWHFFVGFNIANCDAQKYC